MSPHTLTPSVFLAVFSLLLSLIVPVVARAGVSPATPTFLLKWGGSSSVPSAPGHLLGPNGLAVDAVGNVYVIDEHNHRVQKFDAWGNFILKWGSQGSANSQFHFPKFIAVSSDGNVYVTDAMNSRVQRFSSNGTYLGQWGTNGNSDGQFQRPHGIAVDAAGNVYVVDHWRSDVQKFTSTGAFLLKWGAPGNLNGQFISPEGVAVDATGNVYVSDSANDRIQKFTSSGAYLTQWGSTGSGNGQFLYPGQIGFDAGGNLHIADKSNDRVQKFRPDGTYLGQWGSSGAGDGQFFDPWGLAFDAAGNTYVGNYNDHRIQKFSGAGASLSQAPPGYVLKWGSPGNGNGQFNFNFGADVATDAAGNVFVADASNHRIQKFSSTGAYLSQWGSFGNGISQFNAPWAVTVDPAGNVFVVDGNNNRIQKFTNVGVYITQWGSAGVGNGQFNSPSSVSTDPAGNVYVADGANKRIQKFTNNGGYVSQWGSPGTGDGQFNFAYVVNADAHGNVYALDVNRVQKFTNTGTYLTQWGTAGSGPGQFNFPTGMTRDASGNIYVVDRGNHRIQKFTSIGTYLSQWGSPFGTGNGQLTLPISATVDAGGNLYVVENNRVQKFVSMPEIAVVSDVGNDQGKQVKLRVLRSSGDWLDAGVSITGYEVYRRDDPLSEFSGSSPSARPASAALEGWTYVGSFPAHGESGYNVVVPTLANSNPSTLYHTAFMVRAATSSAFTFYDSSVEYGTSVDNLSPSAPIPFLAAYASGATNLHWGVSSATDFAAFRLYRGASSGFTPGPGNLIATTTDTDYVDPGFAGSWYKLAAVDVNGNEGVFAVVGPGQTTDVTDVAPLAFGLEGVRPNPASSRDLAVRFVLPVRAAARLDLFDVAGRVVAARDVGSLGAGAHMVNIAEGVRVAPGLYFVRLQQGAQQKTVRVTVVD